ncbi:MAG: hypothetical protein OER82_02040 [Nitrosopumilus sp.]|nr:hypothetical protein [Nitrosopumilus sp.]
MKVRISIVDDDGNSYEGEIQLEKNQKSKIVSKPAQKKGIIRVGSTSDKISELISEEFFDVNRTISDIVTELKTHDYHFKSPALTLPLRTLVRNKMLKKTKDLPDGVKSKHWTYVRKNGN